MRRRFCSVISRNAKYDVVQAADIDFFSSVLGSGNVLQGEAVDSYNTDWMSKYRGATKVVLRPKTTEEVSQILRHCNERKLAVTPQGGNTGLVGGSVPVFDEIVLTLQRMNEIHTLDETSSILTCDSGCILENLDHWLGDRGMMMPLDLGAKGTCQIGGNVSTNAGGLRFLRYGSLRGTVLGVEVVLASGEVLNLLSPNRKDTTGYDLKQLFIGGEGTLGVVTKVAISVSRKPQAVNVMFLGLDSWDNVLATQRRVRSDLGEIISAIEYLDSNCMQLTLEHQQVQNPLPEDYPFYMLIETHGNNNDHDQEKIMSFLEASFEEGIVSNGSMAENESHIGNMWAVRERISESLGKAGAVYKYDISLPVEEKQSMIEKMQDKVGEKAKVYGFGHLGDGNLHLNISAPKRTQELDELIEPYVYELVQGWRGSISAEHGIGRMKPNALTYTKPDNAVEYMKHIKTMFDPNGILNPYKVLPQL